MTKTSLALALMISTVSACGDAERPPTNPWEGPGGANPGALSVTGTAPAAPRTDVAPPTTTSTSDVDRLAGTAGQVRDFASTSPSVQMYNGLRGFRLTATDAAGRWQMMAQLELATPISDAMWAPGTSRTITMSGAPGGSASSETVRAIACSGPAMGAYTFDSQPREVTVQVAAGTTPASRVVTFSQTFADPSQVVTATFEYLPR